MEYDTKIEKVVRQLIDGLPSELKAARSEIAAFLRANLSVLLQRMDLVSREEYDIQVRLLERLQRQVTEIEAALERYEKPDGSRSPAE